MDNNRLMTEQRSIPQEQIQFSEEYRKLVNSVAMPCCVMSVEIMPDGGYGDIRIICANQYYKDIMGPGYYDNMLYYELVPQDNKFEDYCYQAAVCGNRMHAYVETRALNCWTDQTLIPLVSAHEKYGFCQFIFEFTQRAESDRMASVSMEASEAVISACIKLMGKDDFDECIDDMMDEILETSKAKAGRILVVDHERREVDILCEKLEPADWPNRIPDDDVVTYELVKSWEDVIGLSNELIVKNEQDMEMLADINPVWAGSMLENGVESLALIPLRREKTIIGFLYVVNYDTDRTVAVKETIELLAFFLGIWISNHQLMAKLEQISNMDALTGLNNRHAMHKKLKHLEEAKKRKPYGVINFDLNGLKTVNDEDGHEAGDKMLIRASELLKKAFYNEDVFRTGGDEFIVILEDISREVFDRKLRRFHEAAEKYQDTSFAMGACWSDGSDEITEVFRIADQNMYEDKEAYYKRKGIKNRRH